MQLPTVVALLTVVATPGRALFPLPRDSAGAAQETLVLAKNITITLDRSSSAAADPLVVGILARYRQLLRNKASWSGEAGPPSRLAAAPALALVSAKITGSGPAVTALGPDTDESYAVNVTTTAVTVTAATAFGLRHGLETLAQLVATPQATIQAPITIWDRPAFAYRGLMIDTGRHFLSLDTIKRAINGMAALKMNVLHWHILDSSSFPLKSLRFPQLSAKGAYSPSATYSLDELRQLVGFAKARGVRIVVEIEMPGHGSFSKGMPELSLSSCADVLDPTRDSTYQFLTEFLGEMTSVFSDSLIYLGGDEVGFDPNCKWPGSRVCGYHCFDKDPSVAKWMRENQMNATQLLDHFWSQVSAKVIPQIQTNGNRTVGVWIADRPNGAGGSQHVWPAPHMQFLPKGSVANVYQSIATAGPILDAGSPVVLSVASSDWYLDYHPDFEAVYSVRPCDALDCDSHPGRRQLLLGGSASQWSEAVDAFNFDADVWVGASALAERLWSDPPLGVNTTATANAAEARHHELSCHWKMWGIATYTRLSRTSEYTQVKDASLSNLCPADWSSPPT